MFRSTRFCCLEFEFELALKTMVSDINYCKNISYFVCSSIYCCFIVLALRPFFLPFSLPLPFFPIPYFILCIERRYVFFMKKKREILGMYNIFICILNYVFFSGWFWRIKCRSMYNTILTQVAKGALQDKRHGEISQIKMCNQNL